MVFRSAGVPPAHSEAAAQWRSRGYIPHFDQPGALQMITFRLGDALPAETVRELAREFNGRGLAVRRQRVEALLDAGHGACLLADSRVGAMVEQALVLFHGRRYRLLAWVIMPNHVHALIETWSGHPISEIGQAWKSFTAKEANRLLGRAGRFWQPEYFDRSVRDERHLSEAIRYIHDNPVKAGLVRDPGEWPFSSAVHTETQAGETPALR